MVRLFFDQTAGYYSLAKLTRKINHLNDQDGYLGQRLLLK